MLQRSINVACQPRFTKKYCFLSLRASVALGSSGKIGSIPSLAADRLSITTLAA
jgi:hypothetical protein